MSLASDIIFLSLAEEAIGQLGLHGTITHDNFLEVASRVFQLINEPCEDDELRHFLLCQ
jgi:hypothetical protein